MEDKITGQPDPATTRLKNGWKGVVFNICFILYYYFTYQLVAAESHTVNSYGLSSPLLFTKSLGWLVLLSLVAEPFAIFYKFSYDQYHTEGHGLRLPGFYIFILFVARFFIRVVFFIAALESIGIDAVDEGTGAGLVATFVFVAELVFVFAITDKTFVGKIKPTLRKEIATRFILLNILVLFTYLFKTMFVEELINVDQSTTRKVLIGLLLFFGLYLPNTMVQFYADWRAARSPVQKSIYILSLILAFISILLF
jgi:hypothetical protein